MLLVLVTMPVASEHRAPAEHVVVTLPRVATDGAVSLEKALSERRSVRSFSPRPLTLEQVAQVLWAAQGATYGGQRRTAPSAGALYPLEVYLAAGAVEGLAPGIYRYRQERHVLERVREGDQRRALATAAVGQSWIARAPAVLAIAAVPGRTAAKYGTRADRYVAIEVGHAGQNVYLQATALGLGTVMVGAFHDDRVHQLLGLSAAERPMALMPFGRLP